MMSDEEIRLEVAMRVYAARFVTDDRLNKANARFAARLSWEAADDFIKEMHRAMEGREKSELEAASK
jgi:hypothetical protein